MALTKLSKQTSENLDYDIYFDDHLPSGDNVSSAVISVYPAEYYSIDALNNVVILNGIIGGQGDSRLTIGSTSISGQVVKQFLSGGTDGVRYKITCTATATSGRIKELEFYLLIDNL